MSAFRFLVWPTQRRVITQHFGANPTYYAEFNLPGHEGVDLRAPVGSEIYAVAPGRVARVQSEPLGYNYGIHVRLEHSEGYATTYAHLAAAYVAVGQEVEAGELLGLAGETGNAQGPHLHLTLKQRGAQIGRWPPGIIDPTPFLLPLLGWRPPVGAKIDGWVLELSLYKNGDLAQINLDGAQLWIGRHESRLIPGGAIIELLGVERGPYLLARVPLASLSIEEADAPAEPDRMPQPTISTVEGWALRDNVTVHGRYAVVGRKGINLRQRPQRAASNIGLVRPGSTLTVLGTAENDYLPVQVRRTDFDGPVQLPDSPPLPGTGLPNPDRDPQTGQPTFYLGWVESKYLDLNGPYATLTYRYGASLRPRPDPRARSIGLIKGFTLTSRAGADVNGYTPVLVNNRHVLNPAAPMPPIEPPRPLPAILEVQLPKPPQDSTYGWVLSEQIVRQEPRRQIGRFGAVLRAAPQRNALALATVRPGARVMLLGVARGEYTPVRIDDRELTFDEQTRRWLGGMGTETETEIPC